jgi:hypothetical protein
MADSSPVQPIVITGTIALVIWKMAKDRNMTIPEFIKSVLTSEAQRTTGEIPSAIAADAVDGAPAENAAR